MKVETRSWSSTGGTTPPLDEAAYQRLFPYYAEVCALSELRKKPGLGVPVQSGIGGHCLLYLGGVERDRSAGFPRLKLCTSQSPAGQGVGISVNAHYRNANWVAADGPDFLWRGALAESEALTREAYARTQDEAKARGVLDGVEFHHELFKDKPVDMSARDYMYEISVATDYAALFGRDVVRARVPLGREQLAAIVDYLNALNAPYCRGERVFTWRLFNNNCVHVTHNALAAAGLWAPWPTGQLAAVAAFNFPVPKNAFVDLMLRTNDLPICHARELYADMAARHLLLERGRLPTAPGALAIATPARADNDVYDTEKLRLIFYDNPFWGAYRFRFSKILGQPRYIDLAANLRHFAALYEAILQHDAAPSASRPLTAEEAGFQTRWAQYIADDAARLYGALATLARPQQKLEDAIR
jgi:hypothetical protein